MTSSPDKQGHQENLAFLSNPHRMTIAVEMSPPRIECLQDRPQSLIVSTRTRATPWLRKARI